jgi:hypothetical protein
VDLEHSVTARFTHGADVGAGCLEDSQAQQSEHRYEREVVDVRGVAAGGEHRLELEVTEPESRRLRRNMRPAHILRRGALEDAVDDAGPVERREHRHTPGDGGGLEAPYLLEPA